jgi:protein-tyrosine phosphatase
MLARIVWRRVVLVKVLFVCTGNICRSPLAEGLLRHLAAEAGLGHAITADSAATHDYEVGDPPDRRAIASAKRRGIDISDQRARQMDASDFEIFDLVIALDRGHRAILRRLAPPEARERIRLLMEFAPGEAPGNELDVPDPYYGDAEGFDPVRDKIERGVKGLLAYLSESGRV